MERMSKLEQELTLVRTLTITCGGDYSQVLGEYFDAIHREKYKKTIQPITEKMIMENFRFQKMGGRRFDKWSCGVEIGEEHLLSVQCGAWLQCTPRTLLDNPNHYVEFEIAIVPTVEGKPGDFVDLHELPVDITDNDFSKEILGYQTIDQVLDVANSFVKYLNEGWEVQYA